MRARKKVILPLIARGNQFYILKLKGGDVI